MSEPKRLVSFRDLAKAKPQPKQNQDVPTSEGTAIASVRPLADSTSIPSAELINKPIENSFTIPTIDASEIDSTERSAEGTGTATAAAFPKPTEKPFEPPLIDRSAIAYQEPSVKASDGRSEPYQTLESTHTGSEQKLYGFLYRETISKGKKVFQATQPYLRSKTGISGPNTLRRAIRGLHEKLSIRVLNNATGDLAGTEYYVYIPKEIIAARREAGIEIHPVTKDIRKRSAGPSRIPSVEAFNKRSTMASAAAFKEAMPNDSNLEIPEPSETDLHDKYNINPNGPSKPSSAPQKGSSDDEKLPKVRKLFGQLSNGGNWKDDRDLKAYQEIATVNLFHITLGLCYSVSRSPEHKMSSLAYAVPAILKHAEDMGEFPDTVLGEIAYKSKRTTMNCIATGKWSVLDWETGKE